MPMIVRLREELHHHAVEEHGHCFSLFTVNKDHAAHKVIVWHGIECRKLLR